MITKFKPASSYENRLCKWRKKDGELTMVKQRSPSNSI